MPLLFFIVLLAAFLPAAAQEAPAPNSSPQLEQPRAGADIVIGKSAESTWPVRIKVFDPAGTLLQQRDVLVNSTDLSVVAGFSRPLAAGEIVQACFLVAGVETMPSAPLLVGPASPLRASGPEFHAFPQPDPVRILGQLNPESASVYAAATPTPPGAGYEVRIYGCGDGVAAGIRDSTGFHPYAVTDAAGQAAITFEQPLMAGQSIKLCQKIVSLSDPSIPAVDGPGSEPTMIANPLDLGRVRYYFTSGVVLSNDQGFQLAAPGTQAALFLGLNADRTWLPLNASGFRRMNFNTYLDVRLTSVPAQTASAGAATLESFVESRKAASFQTGVYLPVVAGRPWASGNGNYSLFFAPLAKASFTTLASTTTDSGPALTQPVTGRFFSSYTFGTRLGVFQHFRSEAAAPDMISYIDFAAGRFGDFEAFRDLTLEENPNGSTAAQHEFLRVRPWRYSLEGLFKVPHSPFVVGFDANIGAGPVLVAKGALATHPFTPPRDDLRFLIGAQFDFSKLLKTLPEL
ncbi:MAG TPA: hypothetical protein VKX49_14300 [Bryobacteraceae bacterium]|nr:hypothetical protein [Bryobacteraceae bacterium]